MRRLVRNIGRRFARFCRAERGVAVIEFALILPIMLAIYIGTIEASTLIIVDRKVQSVAGTIGDLVARSNSEIKVSDFQDYFRAASGIMAPYSSADVKQTVTAVRVMNDRTTDVVWQATYEDGTYRRVPDASLPDTYALPAEMIDIALGDVVIAAEATYDYTPLFGIVIDQSINLYRSNFYMPRFQGTITIVN